MCLSLRVPPIVRIFVKILRNFYEPYHFPTRAITQCFVTIHYRFTDL